MSWPEEYRDPNGPAVLRFASEHAAEIEYWMYLQWQAAEQLAGAQTLTRELGMPIGLYGDYAVGSNPSGSETWVDQTGYRLGAEIGAPPDPLALKGQGWGLPPPDPVVMESQRLEGFIRLIRGNMRFYGALRLDHVMSLFRLWWVAAGRSPVEGAYVHYPLHQLLTALALESARAACVIVGEDLGVVPDEMRHAMPQFGLYHYKVLLFEKDGEKFRRPEEYVRKALATVTTHDMPTLRSFWEGRDIELRRELNLYPSLELETGVRAGARSRPRVSVGGSRGAGAEAALTARTVGSLHAAARAGTACLPRAYQRVAGRPSNRGLAGDDGSRQRSGHGTGISQLAAQAHREFGGIGGSKRPRRLLCRYPPGSRVMPAADAT